jgi:hypothetical protein
MSSRYASARTGELLIRTKYGPLVIPLRMPELLERVMAAERVDSVGTDILHDHSVWHGVGPRSTVTG